MDVGGLTLLGYSLDGLVSLARQVWVLQSVRVTQRRLAEDIGASTCTFQSVQRGHHTILTDNHLPLWCNRSRSNLSQETLASS